MSVSLEITKDVQPPGCLKKRYDEGFVNSFHGQRVIRLNKVRNVVRTESQYTIDLISWISCISASELAHPLDLSALF